MKPHPATKHLISKEYTLGKGANWLHGLGQLKRWNNMAGISDFIDVPLMWPYAWTILTNGAEAAAHPDKAPPVYLVWIEETWDISEQERAIRLACLMFYWWLCDRADIRFLVFSLREKPRRRRDRRNTSPIVSPWWDKIDVMDEWLKIK